MDGNNNNNIVEEGVKEVASDLYKATLKAKTPEGKKATVRLANAYNDGMNKRAEVVAGAIVKKPEKGASKSEVEKFKRDMITWKATYKAAEVAATSFIAVGPIDTLLKVALGIGVAGSNDPVDAELKKFVNSIAKRVPIIQKMYDKLKEEVKEKILSAGEIDKKVKILEANSMALARDIDRYHVAKREDVPRVKKATFNNGRPVKESEDLDNSLKFILFDEHGQVTESTIESVIRFIERSDINSDRDTMMIESTLHILNNTIN